MSGGTFDYKQYQINDIIEDMESFKIKLNKKDNNDEEFSLNEYVEDHIRFEKELDNALEVLKKAKIYVQRIDWFIAGDDGEESFYKRLKEDMKEIQ